MTRTFLHKLGWTLGALICLTWASASFGATALLSHFDSGYDADFSLGDPKASIPNDYRGDDIKLVDGRFGKAVFIRKFPEKKLLYMMKNVLTGAGGTIEFWYKPEWNSKTLQGPDEGQGWLRGKPVTLSLIHI